MILYQLLDEIFYICVAVCCVVLCVPQKAQCQRRVLQCDAVCCSALQRVAVYRSVLQCIVVYCSVLQCIAVRCSVCYSVSYIVK